MTWITALVLFAQTLGISAIQPPAPAPKTSPQQRTDPQDPENYLRPSDPLPPLKLDYFTGKWTFEWEMPDTIFGPGGTITGTETYEPSVDGRFIESDIEASGPAGAYKQHAILAYNEAGRVISRYEKDSRGFELLAIGRIATDQGFYLINFESAPFIYKAQTLRIKTVASLTGPVAYRLRVQLSVDGGPYQSIGNPWWRRQTPPPAKP